MRHSYVLVIVTLGSFTVVRGADTDSPKSTPPQPAVVKAFDAEKQTLTVRIPVEVPVQEARQVETKEGIKVVVVTLKRTEYRTKTVSLKEQPVERGGKQITDAKELKALIGEKVVLASGSAGVAKDAVVILDQIPVLTKHEQVEAAVGKLVTIQGEFTDNTKDHTIIGVEVASNPDLSSKKCQATGIVLKWTVTKEESDRLGDHVAHRGPGTYYRLLKPGTNDSARVQPLDGNQEK